MKKNVCNCKDENYTKLGAFSSFKLFPIFDRTFVRQKINTRTEIISNLNTSGFSLNVDRVNGTTCDNIMTKQQKLQLKNKTTPFRMPFNHYRKRSTCRGGQDDFNTSGGLRQNGDCLENVKVIKETTNSCDCPKTLITSRLVGKTGVRFINDTTYKNYLQSNGMLYSQNSQGLLNENKVSGKENLYKIGNLEKMAYNVNLNPNAVDPNCMIYRKRPISVTNVTYTTKNIPTATKKFSNPKYGKTGSVSSRSRVHRLKYQAKLSSQINHSGKFNYNNCINGEECSQYKNPGSNNKNKNTSIECTPSRINGLMQKCPLPFIGDNDFILRVIDDKLQIKMTKYYYEQKGYTRTYLYSLKIPTNTNATVNAKTSHYTITNEANVDVIKGDFDKLFTSTMTFLEITRNWTTIAVNLNTIDVELPKSEPKILRVIQTNINPNNTDNIVEQINERVHYNYGPYIELDLNNYNIRIRLTEDYLNYQTHKIYLYSLKVSPFLGAITTGIMGMGDYQASSEKLTTTIKGKFQKLFDANMSFIELTKNWKIIANISNLSQIPPTYSSDLINIIKTNLNPNFVSMINLNDKTISYYY